MFATAHTSTNPQGNDPASAPRTGARAPVLSGAVLRTELRLMRREPGAIFWVIVFPTLLLTILGLIPGFREPDPEKGGLRVVELYVPIAVLLSMITAGIQSMPTVLTGYRERGILRRLSTTPARPVSLLLAQITVHGAAVAVSALLALAVGRIAYDVPLPQQPFGYAVALVLAASSALALGTVVSALSSTTKVSTVLGSIVFFPAMFTAGVWLPVQTMPETLRTIVEFSPLGAASQALDQAMSGNFPDVTYLGVTGLWAVLLVTVAARWFRWE